MFAGTNVTTVAKLHDIDLDTGPDSHHGHFPAICMREMHSLDHCSQRLEHEAKHKASGYTLDLKTVKHLA